MSLKSAVMPRTPPEGRAEVGCLFVLVLRGRKNLGLSLERSLLADIVANRVLGDKDIGCCAMLGYAMPLVMPQKKWWVAQELREKGNRKNGW